MYRLEGQGERDTSCRPERSEVPRASHMECLWGLALDPSAAPQDDKNYDALSTRPAMALSFIIISGERADGEVISACSSARSQPAGQGVGRDLRSRGAS